MGWRVLCKGAEGNRRRRHWKSRLSEVAKKVRGLCVSGENRQRELLGLRSRGRLTPCRFEDGARDVEVERE